MEKWSGKNWKNLPCPYCGRPMAGPTRDHVMPKSRATMPKAGHFIVIVCSLCNHDKADKDIYEYYFFLKRRLECLETFIEKNKDKLNDY